jgi:hypothetical protein
MSAFARSFLVMMLALEIPIAVIHAEETGQKTVVCASGVKLFNTKPDSLNGNSKLILVRPDKSAFEVAGVWGPSSWYAEWAEDCQFAFCRHHRTSTDNLSFIVDVDGTVVFLEPEDQKYIAGLMPLQKEGPNGYLFRGVSGKKNILRHMHLEHGRLFQGRA